MYLILHAFSRRNAGDGLLVDLTLDALQDAGISQNECVLVALDPESFDGDLRVIRAPGEPFARATPRLAIAAIELLIDALSAGRFGKIGRLVRQADGLIAVGGGYLVADRPVRQLGVLINHMVQLSASARATIPTVYLSQSIGPLNGIVGRMTQSRLARIDRLYVRDDLTLSEIGTDNTCRIGDLAVMKLANEIGSIDPVAPADRTIIIARDLPAPGDYYHRLNCLFRNVPDPIWAVQSDGHGTRSDRAFYKRLGYFDAGKFGDLIDEKIAGVVISVRLHGAIASLLAGRPAIHLAYERKGWGAYEDLGLAEYVHDARTFDFDAVSEQARSLQSNPQPFWDLIRSAAPPLKAQYSEMISELSSRLLGRP